MRQGYDSAFLCVYCDTRFQQWGGLSSDDDYYRRRIQIQLNCGEGRHGVARHVFHGQRGELRQRYRQGQEDQLGVLGLVVNMIVLWNTRYMQDALDVRRAQGQEVPYLITTWGVIRKVDETEKTLLAC